MKLGTDFAHIFGCMIVTSYLFLFIDFFKETYKTKASKTSKKSASKQKVESKKSKKSKNSKKSTKLRQRNKKQNIGHDSAFSEH